jgi:hypothetical protein
MFHKVHGAGGYLARSMCEWSYLSRYLQIMQLLCYGHGDSCGLRYRTCSRGDRNR